MHFDTFNIWFRYMFLLFTGVILLTPSIPQIIVISILFYLLNKIKICLAKNEYYSILSIDDI